MPLIMLLTEKRVCMCVCVCVCGGGGGGTVEKVGPVYPLSSHQSAYDDMSLSTTTYNRTFWESFT